MPLLPHLKKSHWKWMMNLSPFNFVRHDILTNGYIQVTIQQSYKLCNHLQKNTNTPHNKNTKSVNFPLQNNSRHKFTKRLKLYPPNNKTNQSLIALFDGLQKGEKGLASSDIQKPHKGNYGVDGCHEDYNQNSLLFFRILPVEEVLRHQLHREMRCHHHRQPGPHQGHICPIQSAEIHVSLKTRWEI